MDSAVDRRPRERRSRARVPATVLVTLLVVAGEFALLTGIYHRGDSVERQQVVQAALAGSLRTAPGAEAVALAGRSRDLLADAGVGDSALRDLDLAATALARRRGDPARLDALRGAVDDLGADLATSHRRIDRQADATHAGVLVVVSLGWFVWFRRLVRRHRTLQEALTSQQALAASEQRMLALVQNGADLVMVLDVDTTASFVSPSSRAVLGTAPQTLLARPVVDLLDDASVFVQLLAHLRSGADEPVQLRMRHADGRSLVVEGVLTNLLAEPYVGGYVLTVRDVTERHALQERLRFQAFHDSLTGLANRQLFADRLTHALERRGSRTSPLVVLFCDLDDFKHVNDSLGHGIGDSVLAIVGDRLRGAIRPGDTAARLGGDEFAVLMEETEMAEAHGVAERLLELLSAPVAVEHAELTVRASIGMAQASPGQTSAEDALRNADVAMYWAKDRGKSTVAVYEPRQHAAALDRLSLRAELQAAIRDDELVLHYQPTVALATEEITGFEALVRWQHPSRGLLSPATFVPVAEQTGLIVPLGSWVLRAACRTAARLQSDRRAPTMAVNIAAQQLARGDFVDEVVAALAESGLPADRLVLEITEGVVLQDLAAVTPRLAALRMLGVRIAIDDFGTGYSSLAYLTQLPVDVLKIDKSFIDQVATDAHGASVTEAILSMSASMQLTTVAEGVELREQATWLRDADCGLGQGYLWSRPVDLAGVHRLLAAPGRALAESAKPVVRAREPDVASRVHERGGGPADDVFADS